MTYEKDEGPYDAGITLLKKEAQPDYDQMPSHLAADETGLGGLTNNLINEKIQQTAKPENEGRDEE